MRGAGDPHLREYIPANEGMRELANQMALGMLLVPFPGGRPSHPTRFAGFEGFEHYIVSAMVQHFGPQVLVGQAGRHYQHGRGGDMYQTFQDAAPVAIGQFTLAQNDRNRVLFETFPGFLPGVGVVDGPLSAFENLANQPVITLIRTDHEETGCRTLCETL